MNYHLPDGRVFATSQPFELDGFNYPANWLDLATPDDLAQRGITTSTDPVPAPIPQPLTKSTFTALEFMERFTQAEQMAIVSATLQSAPVKLWYDKMLAAESVSLVDARTKDGLDALVAAGLLTQERRDVLGAPSPNQTIPGGI